MFTFGFNIDHIATLRNARGEDHPSLKPAVELAQKVGVHQITAHLREDRRHIKDEDIEFLALETALPLNLEMAIMEEMLNTALNFKPYSVCLVPENRDEITTEGGLDVLGKYQELTQFVRALHKGGIRVSLFIDAHPNQLEAAIKLGVDAVEFNTGRYANSSNPQEELLKIKTGAQIATRAGMAAHAGHGLTYTNLPGVAAIKDITEFNIGQFIIGQALYEGLEVVLTKMIDIIKIARA